MNSRVVSWILGLDSLLMFLSGFAFMVFFRPAVTILLPDASPSLYPRMFGAARLGFALILWMAARNPLALRDVIPGAIVSRVLDLAVLWPMILVARITMPVPFGVAVVVWAVGTVVTVIVLGLEGLFWFNTRPKKQ